jgi:hypothetical protein
VLVHGFVHRLQFGSGRSAAHASFRGRPRDEVILRRGRLDSAALVPETALRAVTITHLRRNLEAASGRSECRQTSTARELAESTCRTEFSWEGAFDSRRVSRLLVYAQSSKISRLVLDEIFLASGRVAAIGELSAVSAVPHGVFRIGRAVDRRRGPFGLPKWLWQSRRLFWGRRDFFGVVAPFFYAPKKPKKSGRDCRFGGTLHRADKHSKIIASTERQPYE